MIFYVGETPTDPVPATATVTVTRADGTTIGTDLSTTHVGVGQFRYTLDETFTTNLDILTLDWRATFGGNPQHVITEAEILGGFYVSLAEIRALPGLSDTSNYPSTTLANARRWFEDLAEDFCDVAFVPRYGREILDGDSSRILLLRKTHRLRKLLSVKVDGASKTLTDFMTYPFGQIVWKAGVFTTTWTSPQNIEVAYEHGYDAPDEDLRQAALSAIQTKLLGDQSGIPDRATSMTTDVGTFGLALAGPGRPTGIPSVDAVLARKSERLSVVI